MENFIDTYNNISEEYINKLFVQFKDAMGYPDDMIIPEVYYDFFNWLIQYKVMLGNYADYINSLGINWANNKNTFEIDKGVLDTITTNTKARQITNYPNDQKNQANMIFVNKKICIIKDGGIYPLNPSLIMTHNPYKNELSSREWAKMINSGVPIVYGMCGKLSDNNKKEKEEKLNSLIKKLDKGSYFYNETTDSKNNEYYASVWSKSLKKTLL